MHFPYTRRQFIERTLQISACVGLYTKSVSAAIDAPLPGLAILTGSQRDSPESRLIAIYRAIEAGDSNALELAQSLVRDVPRFQLGQLVYGDLLLLRSGTTADFSVVGNGNTAAREQLQQLREEARRRLRWMNETPESGLVPKQVVRLSSDVRHMVTVDASHSRVYVFENRPSGLTLLRSFYASIGRAGYDKRVEGDLRTPLGVYFITGVLPDRQLDELYGIGALPLNFPNEHDRRMGRTGSGIWLHGVPRSSYSRRPYATEGCVALANDDMSYLMDVLEPRRTPVVIADEVQWVRPAEQAAERRTLEAQLARWRRASARNDTNALNDLQTEDISFNGTKPLRRASTAMPLRNSMKTATPKSEWRNVSIFQWRRQSDVAIVNFTVLSNQQKGGTDHRQYWTRENGRWRLFFDGAV